MSLAKKLLHTRYRVNDLERTVQFYREVLGLQEVRRHKSPQAVVSSRRAFWERVILPQIRCLSEGN